VSSVGAGYDLSASAFCPDGRVFQVVYAMQAVENSSTFHMAIGAMSLAKPGKLQKTETKGKRKLINFQGLCQLHLLARCNY
uniref:Proteasome alpha-type subunits domain-containing protein n=1 Tax=Ailuropoda melanoleuca TaxID=9646 RepID=A0A7N5KPU9_AILME